MGFEEFGCGLDREHPRDNLDGWYRWLTDLPLAFHFGCRLGGLWAGRIHCEQPDWKFAIRRNADNTDALNNEVKKHAGVASARNSMMNCCGSKAGTAIRVTVAFDGNDQKHQFLRQT